MDDFVISNLNESRNEWCSRLISIFTPLVNEGIRSIFKEAWDVCVNEDEANKYLMTFQNLLARVVNWNDSLISEECKRVVNKSQCNYIPELISSVHITQVKILTSVKLGNACKKISIEVPTINKFLHNVYIKAVSYTHLTLPTILLV